MGTPTREQAEGFLADYCRQIPPWDGRGQIEHGFEVWLPKVVEVFCGATEQEPNYHYQPVAEPMWQVFYDAAWEFCRRGILRPSPLSARGMGTHGTPSGDGFSLTEKGREWLRESSSGWYPTDPNRYVSSLSRVSALCGNAFTQRAHEAARCQDTGNSLACCAMCGAAAESVLIAVATEKIGDRDQVFKLYTARDGRRRLLDRVTGGLDGFLIRGLKPGFDVLAYWRDSAAHGQAETITDLEAEAALLTLYRFAMFVADNWEALTAQVRAD